MRRVFIACEKIIKRLDIFRKSNIIVAKRGYFYINSGFHKVLLIGDAAIMSIEKHKECDGCVEKDRCQDVYERLCKSDAEPVALKAFTAFVVPLVAFMLVYVFVSKKIAENLDKVSLEVVSILSALVGAAVITVIFRIVLKIFLKIKF